MMDFETPPIEEMPTPETEQNTAEAGPRPDLVAKYTLFKKKFNPKADVVYHPCGSNDVSPSIVFPTSKVIYVELDESSVEALKRGGFEAHLSSALEFNPGNVDILILLNPQIQPDVPASYVADNGFILCNDYHETATALHASDQYQIRAIIRVSKSGELIIDTENLEDCWKEMETDEELRAAPFDWGSANYNIASHVVEVITGKTENVLAEYKKIIITAREQQRQINAEMLRVNPELADIIGNPDKETVLMFEHNGRRFALATALPKKKGTVDDIFVFQKIAREENKES